MSLKKLALVWIIILGISSIPFWPIMDNDWEDYADCSGAFFSMGDIKSSHEFSERALERAKDDKRNVTKEQIENRVAKVFSRIMLSDDSESTREAYFNNCGIEG